MATEDLSQRSAQDVLRETDRTSYGVVRILSDSAGSPGEEREYQTGDEALVEAGQAEWVVAPVHLPAAGRRLDTDAEREPAPADGVEAYPPAEPTDAARRVQARVEGAVGAQVDEGLGEKLTARRREVARRGSDTGGDAKLQAELGGRGARSGPVTAQSDLPVDQPTPADRAAADEEAARANEPEQPRASRSAKNSKE
jgi:hypothetical protein